MKARWFRTLGLGIVIAAVFGCASTPPRVDPDSSYLTRAVTRARDGISVSASVLHEEEIEEVFDVRLDLVGIQPVWLRIENLSAFSYVLFLRSVDPDYFSPYEAAHRSATLSPQPTQVLYRTIRDLEIQRFIPPGARWRATSTPIWTRESNRSMCTCSDTGRWHCFTWRWKCPGCAPSFSSANG